MNANGEDGQSKWNKNQENPKFSAADKKYD